MRPLRLLAVPLLASMWIASGVAQSAPSQQNPFPLPFLSQPVPGSYSFSLNAGKGGFLPAPKPGETGFNQAIRPLSLRRYSLLAPRPNADILFQMAPLQPTRSVVMAQNEVCYTVREYTFTRDDPTSDATRMRDYYACRPSSNFHLKSVSPVLAR